MIKITFEFPTVDSAVAFLKKGKLSRTNETVAVRGASIAASEKRETVAVDEAKPLSARERRLAGKNKSQPKAEPKKTRSKSRKKNKDKPDPNYNPVSGEITDADLAKAASLGAEEIGPKLVTAFLEQFGVGHVSDLKDDKRKEFLDLLDKEIEAENRHL